MSRKLPAWALLFAPLTLAGSMAAAPPASTALALATLPVAALLLAAPPAQAQPAAPAVRVAAPATADAAPAAAAAAPAAAPAGSANGNLHTLNLKAADIGVLVQTVSEITGRSFIVDPRVEGRVTVVSSKPMDAEEVYSVFQSVLRVHGFAAVPAGDVVKIVPDAIAAQDGGIGAVSGGGPDALVTRMIEVTHVSAQELAQWLRPLLPQQGHLAAHADSNTLLVTDRAANVERLERIVQRIDRGADAEIEVIALEHANATEIARTLGSLEQAGAAGTPGAGGATRLVADTRTNSLLLSGDRAQRLRLRTLIAHLDTPLAGSDSTEVLFLRYARAEDLVPILEGVAKTLTGDAPGEDAARTATIQPHGETNALVVTATPAIIRQLEGIVRQLDIRRAQVLVEAVIVEVNDELADEIGVQWQSTNYDGSGDGYIGGTNFPGSSGAGGIVGALQNPVGALDQPGLNLGYVGGTVTLPIGPGGRDITVLQIGALIKAFRGDTRANILSQPSVVTLDHTEAEIKVVQEVPFLTGQYTNTSTSGGQNLPSNPFQTIEREDVGVILTVTPHINEGDSVRLDIHQEVSSLSPNVTGAVDLITSKRELTTSVLVSDGGMLVLGGLTNDESRENVQGVPGLSRIPLLGNLFKSRAGSRSKRNLMIFLRPIILRDAITETSMSSNKYNYLRTEQMRMRDSGHSPFRGDRQPVLPALPEDLFQTPPPVPPVGDPAARPDAPGT